MDYMYVSYEEFFEFILSDRFIPSEQKRYMLHKDQIKNSIIKCIKKGESNVS